MLTLLTETVTEDGSEVIRKLYLFFCSTTKRSPEQNLTASTGQRWPQQLDDVLWGTSNVCRLVTKILGFVESLEVEGGIKKDIKWHYSRRILPPAWAEHRQRTTSCCGMPSSLDHMKLLLRWDPIRQLPHNTTHIAHSLITIPKQLLSSANFLEC